MERDSQFFRHILLHYFDMKKTAAQAHLILSDTYGNLAPSERTCREWFQRYKSGDQDVSDKPRTGQPRKFDDTALLTLLDADCTLTLSDYAKALNVCPATISNRLHEMGKIQKEGKWVPHDLTKSAIENRFNTSVSLLARHKKKSFLWRIITGDEKWIYFSNPKRKRSWVNPGQPAAMCPKRNIHGKKVMLSIWWDEEGVIYYELLSPAETITGDRYKEQLLKLNEKIMKKRPAIASNRRKVILLQDNARPHVAKCVKETLLGFGWELLPHPAYSPDLAPSDYHLFRSMQNALAETRFSNYEEVRKWIAEWISSKDQGFYRKGIQLLPERWSKVIESKGKYFD